MSLYKQFETDKEVEKKGIWLEYDVNSKGEPIRILVARSGGANETYLKRLEARAKPHRRQIQNETMERARLESLVKEVFAETVVLAWENVEDRDGNAMEFSKENCMKLFTDLPALYEDIQEQSGRLALFRKEIRETDAKN